jgi:lipid-binding SYLF domain-containing protein
MMRPIRSLTLACAVVTAALAPAASRPARAATAAELTRASGGALSTLYARQPSAKLLGQKAKGILVFPAMVKAGFMFGGQIGEGALRKNGKVVGYYNSVAASYGFQAGAQKFGYALFFMSNDALAQLDATKGFEVGIGPSLVIVDEGKGKSITSNTITSDVYAFIFDQKGLMAGAGIQGSKITRIKK